jgi:hypothetical protein
VAQSASSNATVPINPMELQHWEPYAAIDAALKTLRSIGQSDDAESEWNVLTITALAQAILKAEWQRAKTGTQQPRT